jgi:hypothetical protein
MEVLIGLTFAYLGMVPLALRRHQALTAADEAVAADLPAAEGDPKG